MGQHEDTELSALIKAQAKYHEAPASLRDRISASLGQATRTNSSPKASPWTAWRQGWGMGLGFAFGTILAVGIMFFSGMPGQQDRIVAQVIDGHVRSLMVAHLSDVTSSDQHTVKPWFSGKLDFAPPVQDLTALGFPLVGGRLDYIDERPVAALVYQHRLHTINLFVWPIRNDARTELDSASRRGMNVTAWKDGDMQFWAVSDLNSKDLQKFSQLLRK